MSLLLSLALATYFMSGLLSLANSARRGAEGDIALFRIPSLGALGVATAANAAWIALRWHALGHPPFAELYGCFVLLALCVGVVSLIMELAVRVRFLGGISSLAAAALLVWSVRFLGPERLLPPALQSAYFAPHVVSYFIAYGALTVAGLAALVLLVARVKAGTETGTVPNSGTVPVSVPNFAAQAEVFIDRAGRIGFPFLTLGLVLGAFWAQAAYADWWAWDPKEVWALVTWLLVAAWSHLWRAHRRGAFALALLLVAVGAMYFTLFGVDLLPTAAQSLHTYSRP